MQASSRELQAVALARLLAGERTVAVGNSSPVPAAAALLARALAGGAMRVMILGSRRHGGFTDGGRELFDAAAQGRIDAFFLSGGQIDGEGNLNLVGLGQYPRLDRRFPGSFGSAYLYFLVPKVLLFREEHSPRVLVPRVDFVSAPAASAPGVYRPGGPAALVTGRCVFRFDRERRRFALESVHPGESLASVRANTGFEFDAEDAARVTPAPAPGELALLRGEIADELDDVYPRLGRELRAAHA